VAKGYQAAVPRIIRTGIGNFSANLRTPLNIINQFLQGKGRDGLSETGRFLANSTFGLGGLLDVATDMGLEAKDEDFGETLAVWGIPDGPYVVLPFMGPGTLRDTLAMPLNILADPLYHYENASVRDKLYVVRTIDLRASLFSGERLIEGSADKYLALREAYLQNRRYRIHDGDPPEDDDFYDEFIDDDATQ
jgi:phospholipid-binding lipoprotein MlaA